MNNVLGQRTVTKVMDMETGEIMDRYPDEYCTEWAAWYDGEQREKPDRLLELEKRYRTRWFRVTYELIEENDEK